MNSDEIYLMRPKLTFAVVVLDGLRRPERGGGYMRFLRVQEYLKKHFQLIFVNYRGYGGKARLLEFLSALLAPIKALKYVRKKQVVAVLVINEFFADIMLGYILASLLRVKLLIFANSIPVKGGVGFEEPKDLEKGLFSSIWSSISTAKLYKIVTFAEALMLYIIMMCLRRAILIPLAPHLAKDLKRLNLTFVPIYPGIGCNQPRFKTNRRWIDCLYVASPLHPQKGAFDVLRAWHEVIKQRPGAKLVIAGRESPLFRVDILREQVKKMKLEGNIVIISKKEAMPNHIILKLMSQAKVFIYPSRKDVCPLVIGEALSVGTPVVTYDLPGIRFAYGDCEAVIRVPEGNINAMVSKIVDILKNLQFAEHLRQTAIEWCKVNQWKEAARKEAKAYLMSLSHAHARR
jgi:glycosyltransferase involved in cell wall biosynthesis